MTREDAQAEAVRRWGPNALVRRTGWADGYMWEVGWTPSPGYRHPPFVCEGFARKGHRFSSPWEAAFGDADRRANA